MDVENKNFLEFHTEQLYTPTLPYPPTPYIKYLLKKYMKISFQLSVWFILTFVTLNLPNIIHLRFLRMTAQSSIVEALFHCHIADTVTEPHEV